jgi:hypothetical protein
MKRLLFVFLLVCTSVFADTVSFSTSGSFSCGVNLTCSFAGNSVTVGTGADTMTFSYTGTTASFDYFVVNPLVLDFGSFTVSSTGTGLNFPNPTGINRDNYVRLLITVTQTLPVQETRSMQFQFYAGELHTGFPSLGTVLEFHGTAQYPQIVYVFETTGIHGFVAAIPEPGTWLLTGTGFAYLRTRRRSRNKSTY